MTAVTGNSNTANRDDGKEQEAGCPGMQEPAYATYSIKQRGSNMF
jgi:hypothetical protein